MRGVPDVIDFQGAEVDRFLAICEFVASGLNKKTLKDMYSGYKGSSSQ